MELRLTAGWETLGGDLRDSGRVQIVEGMPNIFDSAIYLY